MKADVAGRYSSRGRRYATATGTFGTVIYAEFYRALWRRRLQILLGTGLCVLLALIFTQSQQRLYTATATVQVVSNSDNNANQAFEAAQRLSRSYAEIYTQGAVTARMSQLIGGPRVQRKELMAAQVKDLDLLAVSGVSPNPRRAALIANAGVRALNDFSPRERLSLITAARPPTSPSSPNVPLTLMLALVGGLILSAAVALALNAVIQPITGPDELETDLDLPVLGVIPHLRLISRSPSWAPASDDPRADALVGKDHRSADARPHIGRR